MKNPLIVLILVLAILLAGCSPSAAPLKAPAGGGVRYATNTPVPDLLGREKLTAYTATFDIDFDGPAKWKYRLVSRKSATLHEAELHIEGIQGAQNPGDIRIVNDGVTTWMTGPGTDHECVQFPTNSGMDPNLVYPEALISMQDLTSLAGFIREEPLAGRDSRYYRGGPLNFGKWKDAHVEYHQEKSTGALLQFAMLASGDDLFFGTGRGTLVASYNVNSFDTPEIQPVTGCEISVPLPGGESMYVRLPGLASFESQSGSEEMRGFYQSQLPAMGWTESEPPALSEGAVQLSYMRGGEKVEIHIEPLSTGSKVKILSFTE